MYIVGDIVHLGGPCSRLEHVAILQRFGVDFWSHRDVSFDMFSL